MRTGHTSNVDDQIDFALSETEVAGGGVLLAVRGELDVATVPALRDRLAALTENGGQRLLVDLREVSFMDSTALAAFIHARKRLANSGRMALVIEPGSYARLILEVTCLESVLDVADTVDDGMALIRA